MKIYIATSWKNEKAATLITQMLQSDGHQVDSFSDPANDRYAFHQSAMQTYAYANSPIHFLNDELPQREFVKDQAFIDPANMVLLIPPGG